MSRRSPAASDRIADTMLWLLVVAAWRSTQSK
jgi:hypothetical protein